MPISCGNNQTVLHSNGCNPNIIFGDRGSFIFKTFFDLAVYFCSVFIAIQEVDFSLKPINLFKVFLLFTGIEGAIIQLAQTNGRKVNFVSLIYLFFNIWVAIEKGNRDCGVQ